MYKIKKTGYVISSTTYHRLIEKASCITYESKFWKIWRAIIAPGTCYHCASMNGRILAADDPRIADIPVHPNCKCYVESVAAIAVGTATNSGANGVDLYLSLYGRLPENYVTREIAGAAGWKRLRGNLAEVLPGKLIGGNVYKNRDHRLPEASGPVWYEADFDYTGGYRNNHRLMFSNDGLLFVTYDHYATFCEIATEDLG